MRKVDITDKLSFEENPVIVIKDKEFEINSDAETMLLIMGDFKNMTEVDAVLSAYDRLFNEASRKAIADMKLPFKDLQTIIQVAMQLVNGTDEGELMEKPSTT